MASDERPRTRTIAAEHLGDDLFFARWTPEQAYAIRVRLEENGHRGNRITATEENRGHCIKVIQIGLWRGRELSYPGDEGFNQIGRLSNAELSRLATEAMQFNEVFS
jgi:hypothetical protein